MNMHKTLRTGASLGIMMAILASCRTAPLYNVTNSAVPPVTSGKTLTLDNVTKAIVDAGMGLGWEMQVVRPGQITGTLHLRSHTAIVDIPYNTASYSIVYNSSQDLNYDPAKRTIHANYNGWIQNLDKAIRGRLSAFGY
ncbi:MAG: hypothetical protein ACREVJ_12260 [Gammaproteobacteria bacterium]